MRFAHVFSALSAACAGTLMISSMVSQPADMANRTLLSGDLKTADVREFLGRREYAGVISNKCGDENAVLTDFTNTIDDLDTDILNGLKDIIGVPAIMRNSLANPMKEVKDVNLIASFEKFLEKKPDQFKNSLNAIEFLKGGGFYLRNDKSPFIRCGGKKVFHSSIVRFLNIFDLDKIGTTNENEESYLDRYVYFITIQIEDYDISEKIRCAFFQFSKDFLEFYKYILTLKGKLAITEDEIKDRINAEIDDDDEIDYNDPETIKTIQDLQVNKIVDIMNNEIPKQCYFVYDLYKKLESFCKEEFKKINDYTEILSQKINPPPSSK
ncbi:hypothetical protein AYI69_g5128 [Smittium culicis]|uniref:Uncharacterized protein n=1 Tax=Smittium culicis TaxID=133412 RepID=A0A1R1Y861_9FUNG|nr:hypothetical protein AYI69_g5128 [Smittium culicis]